MKDKKSRLKEALSWIAIILLMLFIVAYFSMFSSWLTSAFGRGFNGQDAASAEMAKIEKTETKTLIYCEECDSWDTALHIHVKAKED